MAAGSVRRCTSDLAAGWVSTTSLAAWAMALGAAGSTWGQRRRIAVVAMPTIDPTARTTTTTPTLHLRP